MSDTYTASGHGASQLDFAVPHGDENPDYSVGNDRSLTIGTWFLRNMWYYALPSEHLKRGKMVTRVMVGGQYIQPHSDYWHIRDLCGVFYASGGWQESFGGRFRHRGPGPEIVPVEPRANRLLLFEPRSDCMHDVEAITDAGKGWERWACSMWFGTPVPSEGEK